MSKVNRSILGICLILCVNLVYAQSSERVCEVTNWSWMKSDSKIVVYGDTECYFTKDKENTRCENCSRGRLKMKIYNPDRSIVGYSTTYLDNQAYTLSIFGTANSDTISIEAVIEE